VSLSGGNRPAVRIQANPTALAKYGMTSTICARDLEPERQHAEGQFRRPDARLHDQRERPAHERRPVQRRGVAYKNGRPVMLTDVAQIVDGSRTPSSAPG
jgi:multidrug efflux pump